MLGKLVNKFKKQSLQEDQQAAVAAATAVGGGDEMAVEPRIAARKSARLAANSVRFINPSDSAIMTAGLSSSSSSASCGPAGGGVFDSATESDDDELERLECMSNCNEGAAAETRKIECQNGMPSMIGASPPTLTSSPPLISEIDTSRKTFADSARGRDVSGDKAKLLARRSETQTARWSQIKRSWDSMGCESGIVLRESVERDDSSRDFENSLDGFSSRGGGSGAMYTDENSSTTATPVHRQDGFLSHFSHAKTLHDGPALDFSALRDRNGADFHTMKTATAQSSNADGEKGGAFRPVIRLRAQRSSTSNDGDVAPSANLATIALHEQVSRTSTPSPSNIIGEKRRWTGACSTANATPTADVAAGTERVSPLAINNNNSPIASRTRGSLSAYCNFANSGTITGSVNNLSTNQQQEVPRAVLTARRTRVRVLYHQGQQPQPQQQQQMRKKAAGQSQNHHHRLSLCTLRGVGEAPPLGESPPAAPLLANKRGRLSSTSSGLNAPKLIKANSSERPSLNFDKMRERMMGGSNGNLTAGPH